MRDDDKFKKMKVMEKIAENKPKTDKYIHSLHEASSKLFNSMDKSNEEKQKLLANVFINAYIAAERLGIKDITKTIEERVKEIMNK